MLRDELGGNCKTRVLMCFKPHSDQNTLAASLQLCNQLVSVKNYPIPNDPFTQVNDACCISININLNIDKDVNVCQYFVNNKWNIV